MKFALQIPLAVAAQAQTPATRARCGSNVLAGDDDWTVGWRSAVERATVGSGDDDETLLDAGGPLEFLSSDALVTDAATSVVVGRGGVGCVGRQLANDVATAVDDESRRLVELRRRRWRTGVVGQRHRDRQREHLRHAVLHVMGQSGGQTAGVQLVKLDQLQQIVEPGHAFVEGVQPAVASFVENLKRQQRWQPDSVS